MCWWRLNYFPDFLQRFSASPLINSEALSILSFDILRLYGEKWFSTTLLYIRKASGNWFRRCNKLMSNFTMCKSKKCAEYVSSYRDGPTFPDIPTFISWIGRNVRLNRAYWCSFHLGFYTSWADDAIKNFSTEHGHIIVRIRECDVSIGSYVSCLVMPFLGLLSFISLINCNDGHVFRVQQLHLIQSVLALVLKYEFFGLRFEHETSSCLVKSSWERNVDVRVEPTER